MRRGVADHRSASRRLLSACYSLSRVQSFPLHSAPSFIRAGRTVASLSRPLASVSHAARLAAACALSASRLSKSIRADFRTAQLVFTVRVAVVRDVVLHRALSIANARFQQINHLLFAQRCYPEGFLSPSSNGYFFPLAQHISSIRRADFLRLSATVMTCKFQGT